MANWLEAAIAYIPSWLEYQVRLSRQPGGAMAIVYRGRVILDCAFGYADLARREPLTPRHRFRAASLSKSFTAAGLLKLAERGKLRLNDPIRKFVPGVSSGIGALKISQVLSHSAGIIRDGDDCGYFYDRLPYPSAEQLLATFRQPPLVRPGTRFKYSNHGYGLLGMVIEAVAGEAYAPWIKREIIDAAGLQETTPDRPPADGVPFARGHTDEVLLGHRMVVPGDYDTCALAPASCIVATASDLARYFAQLSPRAARSVISAASRRAMTRARVKSQPSGSGVSYGYGIVSARTHGWNWFGHTGGLQGYVARVKVFPGQDMTVCVLANAADAPAELWTNGAVHILQTFERRGAPASRVKNWTGRWWGLWGALDLVAMGNTVLVANPQTATPFLDASELKVTATDKARIDPSPGFLYFAEAARRIKDDAGRDLELWLGGDKYLPEAPRAAEVERLYGKKTGGTN